MLITKVELRNIKNHAEAEFSFQPGVIAVCGPNGAGKTTILEAIAWVLFDHLDYKRDDFVKRGAKRGQASVRFKSDLDGREYIVSRDTGGAYSVYDPETKTKLVEQKNQVVPWLQKHIGVEPGTDLSILFKTTIGVPQGAFTYDFTLAPANRKAVFDQILKVEEYRRASDNLRETLRHFDGRIAEFDKRLAEAEGELKAWDETQREHAQVGQRLAQMETESAEAVEKRDRAAKEFQQLDDLRMQIESHRGAIERLKVQLKYKQDSLTSARESAEHARAAARIVEAVEAGYERYVAASNRLAELEKQRVARDELRAGLTEVERELVESRSRVRLIEERLAEIDVARKDVAALSEAVAAQAALEARIAEMREARGELQGLKRSIEALDRELDKLRQRYAALQKQVDAAESQRELAARVESLTGQRQQLDEEIGQMERALAEQNLRREQARFLQKDAERMQQELQRVTVDIARLSPMVSLSARLPEIESRHHAETERAARLRAELTRDDQMIRALDEGGICPLLTEKCLNLKNGETLDSRFRSGLVARQQEIETLEQSLQRLVDELRQARAAAGESSRMPHLQAEQDRLTRESEAKKHELAAIQSNGHSIDAARIDVLKKQRAGLEVEIRQSQEAAIRLQQVETQREEMDDIRKEGEAKRAERDALDARVREIGEIETLLAEADAELRRMDDPRGRAASLQRLIAREAELKREGETVGAGLLAIEKRLAAARAELDAFAGLDQELGATAQTRAQSEADYHAYIQNLKIAATVAAREQEVVDIAADVEEAERSLAQTTGELDALEKQYDPQRFRAVGVEFDQWRNRATQLATQLDHTRELFTRLQAQLDRLGEVRQRMQRELAGRDKARSLKETADFIRDILQKAAPFITESYLLAISVEANNLYREITGRYDVTLRWTREYEITLEEEGRERPFLNLSGGEQMAAALAIRLALLKELSEINLAFFDEPTTNMDEERRRNLAQQLGRIKDFHQLFVISHDDSFEGYTDQIVMLGGA